jgi:AcrR family transcriptional regulator
MDRRIKKTRASLARALIALTLEQGFEAVSIRDLTERAGVGYATFFRHYAGKDALLDDVLDVFLDELMRLLEAKSPDDDPAEQGAIIFGYVQAHHTLCEVLFKNPRSALLLKRIREAGVQAALTGRSTSERGNVPIEVVANHMVASTMALIEWWLEHDMPYPPRRMGEIYHELVVRPTRSLDLAADG